MVGTHPVDQLMDEHRVIERVLTAMEKKTAQLDAKTFPGEFFEQALDFFRNFADGCHHHKEEQTLFPMLKSRGVPEQGGPIGCMLKDHEQGRSYLAGIRSNLESAKSGSPDAVEAVRHNANEYIGMLRQHIFKEDNVLFRLAHHVLTPADTQALEEQFERAGRGDHEKYHALADQLAG